MQNNLEALFFDLKEDVKALLKSQSELSGVVIRLTENIKTVDKIEKRLEDLEKEQKERDIRQDDKINRLSNTVQYGAGAVAIVGFLVPIAVAILL